MFFFGKIGVWKRYVKHTLKQQQQQQKQQSHHISPNDVNRLLHRE